jgi:hypothetical protein
VTSESQHKKKHWRISREDAATRGMYVEQRAEGWVVMWHDKTTVAGPFQTQAEAWSWIGSRPTKRYGR